MNPYFDVDFNVVDHNGYTPLHTACIYGQFEVVKFMLDNSKSRGIDTEKKDINYQRTAQEWARARVTGYKNIEALFDNPTKKIKILLKQVQF